MKIKTVLSYIHYPMCIARYFDEAFRRRSNIELFTVGPFTGSIIPWGGGMRLPERYVREPSISLPANFISISPDPYMIQKMMPWKPDLWVQIDAGFHFAKRPEAETVVHIGTDPHVLLKQYRLAKEYSDICFGMQSPYLEKGDILLPYAADPVWHAPCENTPKEYDAALIGLHYEQRDRLVNRLRGRGLNVYYGLGPVYEEYRALYCRSKVALSWSSLADTPARVYEGMAMGVPVVANRTPDLMGMFVEGDHFLGFDTVDEAVGQVEILFTNPELRETMGGSAHRKVFAQHLWDHRVTAILERCGFIS